MKRWTAALASGCLIAASCAPSLRLLHEGNVYFEKCYGADFDARVSPAQREACWQAWLADYTRRQPAHRIDYAMRRVEAIQAGEATLKLPGVAGGESAPPTDPSVARLIPAHGARAGAEVETTLDVPEGKRAVELNGCAEACSSYQHQCGTVCPKDEQRACLEVCAREHEICLKGCY